MRRRLLGMLLGSALLWLALAYPARWLWGEAVLRQSLVALGLCLAPGLVTVLWGSWAAKRSPEAQLLMLVGSTGLRMVFVIVGGLVVFFRAPGFRDGGFWGWIIAFYLLTLALEMLLLLKPVPARELPGPAERTAPTNTPSS
jgi:hypothetical protein